MPHRRSLWLLNHYAVTPDLPGGTRHFDLGCELTRMGYDVTIFASAFSHRLRQKVRLLGGEPWAVEELEGVKFIWLPSCAYSSNDWRRLANMLDYSHRAYRVGRRLPQLEPRISPPDAVIGCSVHLLAVAAGYYLSRYHQARFLMEVRDLWPQTFLDMGQWREGQLRVRFFRWLERYLYARAERIIVLSPLTQGYLASLSSAWAEKALYIPNGTRVERFENVAVTLRDAARPLRLMYLGAIGVTNGLELVLQAIRLLNQAEPGLVECDLVGEGPERARLECLAREWGLDNVRFRGAVPRAQVPQHLAQADVLLLVQKEVLYGSSNKLYDYMAAGKPIIFAMHAEHNIPAAACGLSAAPDDPEDLAAKIRVIAHMPLAERLALGQHGRDYVRRRHDYSILAKRLAETLQSLGARV